MKINPAQSESVSTKKASTWSKDQKKRGGERLMRRRTPQKKRATKGSKRRRRALGDGDDYAALQANVDPHATEEK